jgi:hypothetical protein
MQDSCPSGARPSPKDEAGNTFEVVPGRSERYIGGGLGNEVGASAWCFEPGG